MKKSVFSYILVSWFYCLFCVGQDLVNKFPIDEYVEPDVPALAPDYEWNALTKGLHFSWASRNTLYMKHRVPQSKECLSMTLRVWKGERANLEAVLFSNCDEGTLAVRMTPLQRKGKKTDVDCATARFLNYVITDDGRGCGEHNFFLKPWLVPDVIDQDRPKEVHARETRPVWCTIDVPRDIGAGTYKSRLEVVNERGRVLRSLKLTVEVLDRILPNVEDQKFHLDLWQQPYSVSRYYGVERWSDAHVNALHPYLKALGRAGQSVITTILFYEPWGEQSHDKFSPMIQTTRRKDGSWAFDYTIFDKYVELCHECGINKQINCYSMVTWDMKFRYFDEQTGRDVDWALKVGTDDYNGLWHAYLADFRKHLEAKGWFEKTCIAMDERSEAQMLAAYDVIKAHGFKMALAGNYHATLNDKLYDYCVALAQGGRFTDAERSYRRDNNLITTVYTCCTESEPNIYSNSLPAEAAFLPIHIAANGLDGYLHWSWINWDEHPLTDSRFRKFGAGDTYCYYPGNRPSVRFERLIEGIHQFEKIQILKEKNAQDTAWIHKLDALLADFKDYSVSGVECAERVDRLESFLNGEDIDIPSKPVLPVTLFSTLAGGMDIPPYRIPGISCGKDGRLIATAARLVCGTDPGYGQVDCVAKISLDNGHTWSEHEIDVAIGDASLINNQKTSFAAAFGDPAVVMDRDHNEVLVMAVAGCTVYSYPTTNRQNPNMIAAIRSLDGGKTWQSPEDQTEAIYSLFDNGEPLDAAFVGGGKLFQSRFVKVGRYYRLYAALAARPGGNRVLYSDDFGRTWNVLGGSNATPIPDGDEPKCEELPDGRVVVSSRSSGGRLMNIYTYSHTKTAEGTWEVQTKTTMDGLSALPSQNPTNGELLIVPARRVEDGKELYVALQSIPTGTGRNNVGIFYKELEGMQDIRDVNAFTAGWDGFYPVSKSSSAYSSLDLQADGRIAFFYEETLTKWGSKPNPKSTSFPNGEGQHNFDGFENVYIPLSLEQITGGKYIVFRSIDRGAYLRNYFSELIESSSLCELDKNAFLEKVSKLSANPTWKELDRIHSLLSSVSFNAEDADTLFTYTLFSDGMPSDAVVTIHGQDFKGLNAQGNQHVQSTMLRDEDVVVKAGAGYMARVIVDNANHQVDVRFTQVVIEDTANKEQDSHTGFSIDHPTIGTMPCATLLYALPGAPFMHKLVTDEGDEVVEVNFYAINTLTLRSDRKEVGNKYSYVYGLAPSTEGEYTYDIILYSKQDRYKRVPVKLVVSYFLQSPTPQMSWLTWNWFARSISHDKMVEIAKGMQRHGLIDAGFSTIVLDDAWATPTQDKSALTFDPIKFPKGIIGLKADLQSINKNLKLGIYSDAGSMTCENYQPGSYEYEAQHVALFDSWGVDMLKYDYCNSQASTQISYSRMGECIARLNEKRKQEGRIPFVYNICEWGKTKPWLWGAEAGGSSWRSTSDAREDWVGNGSRPGVLAGVDETRRLWMYAGVNRFNDLDMMCIGLHGLGGPSNNTMHHMQNGGKIVGLTDEQARTQMSLWCMLASPLSLTCDLRSVPAAEANIGQELPQCLLSKSDVETLTNAEILSISQDALGQQAEYMEHLSTGVEYAAEGYDVYVKDLSDGRVALAITNRSLNPISSIEIPLTEIYLKGNKTYICRDVWCKKNKDIKKSLKSGSFNPCETKVFVLSPKQ